MHIFRATQTHMHTHTHTHHIDGFGPSVITTGLYKMHREQLWVDAIHLIRTRSVFYFVVLIFESISHGHVQSVTGNSYESGFRVHGIFCHNQTQLQFLVNTVSLENHLGMYGHQNVWFCQVDRLVYQELYKIST